MRIFFDTNVLVSALTTRGLCADLFRLVLAEHELLTGEVNLAELRRTLAKKFKARPADVAIAEDAIRRNTVVPKPLAIVAALPVRDPDDAWVLASAVDAKADVLIAGDRDLLAVARSAPIRILDPRGLWELLRPRK